MDPNNLQNILNHNTFVDYLHDMLIHYLYKQGRTLNNKSFKIESYDKK